LINPDHAKSWSNKMRLNVSINTPKSFPIDPNFLGIARHDLATLAREFKAGRMLRLISMATHLRLDGKRFDHIHVSEWGYELRDAVFSVLGELISDEGDYDGTMGVDVGQASVALYMAYGDDWLLRAYEDHLDEEVGISEGAAIKIAGWQSIYDRILGPTPA
jgi:hypothetical protein